MRKKTETTFCVAIKTSLTLRNKQGIKFRSNDTLKQQSNSSLRGFRSGCFLTHIKVHEEYFRTIFPLCNSRYCLSENVAVQNS